MATLDVIENAEWKEHFNPHDGVGVNVYQVGQMLPRAGGHKIHSTLIISRDGPHQHFKVYFVKLCLILCPVGPSNPCITFRDKHRKYQKKNPLENLKEPFFDSLYGGTSIVVFLVSNAQTIQKLNRGNFIPERSYDE